MLGQTIDLRPRVILHTIAGDAVIDPFGPQDTSAWSGAIKAIVPGYDVVFGEPQPGQVGPTIGQTLLSGAGLLLLVVGGAFMLARL